MGRTADYSRQSCSIAATLEVIGDPWTLLVIRDAFNGVSRFEQWQERLGESGHYFPLMRTVEPRIGAGLDLLDRDHDAIHGVLERLFQTALGFHRAVTAPSTDARDHAARLSDAIEAAGPPLLRHLDDEEDIVIPLIQLRGLPG